MTQEEIVDLVREIKANIKYNKRSLTYRKYETFLERIGMSNRRNFKVLAKIEKTLANEGIYLWCGKESRNKIKDFNKNETITFRMMESNNQSNGTIEYQHAGTIYIEDSKSGFKFYKHQIDAFEKLTEYVIKSNKTSYEGLLNLPTGGGKTITAAHWLSKNFLDKGKKVLWIAHRHELLNQAFSAFAQKVAYKDVFPNSESFNYRIISGQHDKPVNIKPEDNLIIASKDSLNSGFNHMYNNWLKENKDELFLVVDEAHHATAKTYRKLINNLKENVSEFKMLGLTATPFRTHDKEQGLLKKVFSDDIVYKSDMTKMIKSGILSQPYFEEVHTGQNFIQELSEDKIKTVNNFDIGSIGENVANTIAKNSQRNAIIVDKYVKNKEKYSQAIVFVINRFNAVALNSLFHEKGIKSDFVVSDVRDENTGVTISGKQNNEKIARFRNKELEVLINVNILTEGMDVPNVQTIFLARPTISTILMTQMIGRGLRGENAGGTKKAYIVSFIDDWQNKINWVNPEKLFIDENNEFEDQESMAKNELLKTVAINKIEEFAVLSDENIDTEALEGLSFIERIPIGLYKFQYIYQIHGEEQERNGEVLVYDNMQQSYEDFIKALPEFFEDKNLTDKDQLTGAELAEYAKIIEDEYFSGCEKYPAYSLQDIKDVLQHFAVNDEVPKYVKLEDREKYDIDKVARELIEKDLGPVDENDYKKKIWNDHKDSWQIFFNYDWKIFLNEVGLAKERKLNPENYQKPTSIPKDEKEKRRYEDLRLSELKEENPQYEKQLRDEVFKKFTDHDGNFYCAKTGYKSKRKINFQVDHIKSMHNGGKTVLQNLQLLTRKENAKKGIN